jgi:hypothetical protein
MLPFLKDGGRVANRFEDFGWAGGEYGQAAAATIV